MEKTACIFFERLASKFFADFMCSAKKVLNNDGIPEIYFEKYLILDQKYFLFFFTSVQK